MRNTFLFIIFCLIVFQANAGSILKTYDIKEAISKNLITLKVNGNSESPHYFHQTYQWLLLRF